MTTAHPHEPQTWTYADQLRAAANVLLHHVPAAEAADASGGPISSMDPLAELLITARQIILRDQERAARTRLDAKLRAEGR